jgi:tryptophan halogenase
MPETNRIERLTIVGGGTAGWLTALIVGSLINNSRDGDAVKVSLIESPSVPSVGVGEATVPSIPSIMRKVGIDETELIRRCNASFKLSVRFDRWFCEASGAWRAFHHPFNMPPALGGVCAAYHFHRYGARNGRTKIAESVIPNVSVAEAGKGPRMLHDGDYDRVIGYAYHLDAALLASFLREVALKRGVEHILDDVEDVLQDERGHISALRLKKAGLYPVEFVVDCTGFRSLILEKVLKEPFISLSNQLLNDRAIPVQLPHRKPTEISPYTGAIALTAGWVWRVPLFSRVGTGYVYSSAFKSDDEARSEFFQYLRTSGDLPADAPEPETRTIKMRVGHSRRSWVNNCVAIGLSGGFVEPLEATGIFLIDVAARWFAGHFPDKNCSPALADRYNRIMDELYAEIRDFIQLHYATTNRPEPYWLAARNDVKLSGELTSNIELWRHRMPSEVDTRANSLFRFWNFIYVLEQKDFYKNLDLPLEGSIAEEHWIEYRESISRQTAELIRTLPRHYDLLAAIRNKNATPHALLMRTRA